jgi:hypothetical protein
MANKIVIKKSSVAGKVPVPADLDVGELGVNVTDKKLYTKDSTGVIVELTGGGGGGSGDVTGPASSTDNALTRFDGTTGKVIQSSIVSLNDDGNFANVNGLAFDTTPTNPPTAIGGMYWTNGDGTPTVILDNDVNLIVGQENLVKVFNNSASTITKGQVVAVNGAQGQRPAVVLADADSEPLSAATLGIASEDIAAGAEGFASTFGPIRGIDTSGFTAGQPVYLSQTAGAFTATHPQAPAHIVFLGWIIKVNASSGEIFLNINNGWELDELHNVLISSPVNGNTLIYDQATAVWKNAGITPGSGISVANGAASITVTNTGVTSFSGGTTGLTPASATAGNVTLEGTLATTNGGTGLTSFTSGGVVYASGTGTLATGSVLTFNGTNLINSGAYTAPSNVSGAGTKTTITGSTGTGQANATGGNGYIEVIGGGGTSLWTNFVTGANPRRRGGIYLQAGTAQADAGGTYVNGSTINIVGSPATNNGTSVGLGSQVFITSGLTTKTDGQTNTAASINLTSSSSTSGSSALISAGNFNTSTGSNTGSSATFATATATNGGNVQISSGQYNISGVTGSAASITLNNSSSAGASAVQIVGGQYTSGGYTNQGGSINLPSATASTSSAIQIYSGQYNSAAGVSYGAYISSSYANATSGANIYLQPGNSTISGATVGKAYITDQATATNYEILTTGNITTAAITAATANSVPYFNGSQILTTGSGLVFDGANLGIGVTVPVKELDVAGSINLTGTIYGTEFSGIYFSGVDNFNAGISAANSGNDLVIAAGSAEQARFTSTGLVMTATAAITSARINPRVSTAASPASITPNIQTTDQYNVTALANAITINAPNGTPVDGNKLTFRFLDDGSARAITWNAAFTAIGVSLPTTTTANKTTYVGCIYNDNNSRWDVIAVSTQA